MRVTAALCALITAASLGLAAAGPARAAGTGTPVIVRPTDEQLVPAGFTGPFEVDFSDAAVGDYTVVVSCNTGGFLDFAESHAVSYDGTNDVQDVILRHRMPPHPNCSVAVGRAGTPDQVTLDFRVDDPAVSIGSVRQSPTVIYSRVRDGYRDSTTTGYRLSRPASVTASVRRSTGSLVRRVRLGHLDAGSHAWSWRGRNDSNHALPVGTYRVRLTAVDDSRNIAEVTRTVTLASKVVTRTTAVSKAGSSGVRSTRGSCVASRSDGVMSLDCFHGRGAQAAYRFAVPASATRLRFHVSGAAPADDLCCHGRITKTGKRTSRTRFRVTVGVTDMRAYDVRSVRISYRYRARI
jgi:FlgD Ig-like domain